MKRTIEFLASVDIEVANPDDMAEATRAAQRVIARAGASGPGATISVTCAVELTREQSRAVRAATLVAENGGSVPRTVEEVAEVAKPILAGSGGEWFVADSRGEG